jgi:uncharacterized protein YndB with AHSA1/START domain
VSGDQARVSVSLSVAPGVAFEIFTSEIDRWWVRGPKYRNAGKRAGFIRLEPGVGGRLFESIESGGEERVFEVGRVKIWEPPSRLAFSWRNSAFVANEQTEVEVVFVPTPSGTLVTVTHRGWASIRDDHPARHGETGAAFSRRIGLWWGDLMTSLREYTRARGQRMS